MPPPKPSRTLAKAERKRLGILSLFEKKAFSKGFQRIAGVDEAGRGPLAGPVVAAACVIAKGVLFEGINDSKLLAPPKRKEIFERLVHHPSVSYGIGSADVEEIDRLNILQATLLAMQRALKHLPGGADCLLVDGMTLAFEDLPCEKIIKGDQRSQSIAAASILAKETRDEWMRAFHLVYPVYGFDAHKGYGTPQHLEALAKYGPSPLHRRTFAPVKEIDLASSIC